MCVCDRVGLGVCFRGGCGVLVLWRGLWSFSVLEWVVELWVKESFWRGFWIVCLRSSGFRRTFLDLFSPSVGLACSGACHWPGWLLDLKRPGNIRLEK